MISWSELSICLISSMLSDCSLSRTHNHIVRKRTLNHLEHTIKHVVTCHVWYHARIIDLFFPSLTIRHSYPKFIFLVIIVATRLFPEQFFSIVLDNLTLLKLIQTFVWINQLLIYWSPRIMYHMLSKYKKNYAGRYQKRAYLPCFNQQRFRVIPPSY